MIKREKLFKSASEKATSSQRFIDNFLKQRRRKFDDFVGTRRQYTEANELHTKEDDKENLDSNEDKENLNTANYTESSSEGVLSTRSFIKGLARQEYSLTKLTDYCHMLTSQDSKTFTEGVIAIRKLLSKPLDPPVFQVIDNGTIKLLLERLEEQPSSLKNEIFWIMTNVASASDCYPSGYLLNQGIIKHIEKCLNDSSGSKLLDMVIWLLANLSGDGDILILKNESLLNKLSGYYHSDKLPVHVKVNILWAFSNVTKDIDSENFDPTDLKSTIWLSDLTHNCLTAIIAYQSTGGHYQAKALSYILNILMKLSNVFTKDTFAAMLTYGCFPKLINLLDCLDEHDLLTLLRLLGNFTAYEEDNNLTQVMVDHDFLVKLYDVLLSTSDDKVKKEIFWTLSNIVCEIEEHTKLFLTIPGFLERLFSELYSSKYHAVRKEIIWCIMNVTPLIDINVVYRLFDNDVTELIYTYLKDSDYRIVGVCLEGLDNILTTLLKYPDDRSKRMFAEIRDHDLISIIEDLILNSHQKVIYKKAYKLLTEYFHKGGNNDSFLDDSGLMDDI
jgi:hypothetical protein